MLEEIFEKAEKMGITRRQIGIHMYGEKNYMIIYMIKNPTIKTLENIKQAVEEIRCLRLKKLQNNM